MAGVFSQRVTDMRRVLTIGIMLLLTACGTSPIQPMQGQQDTLQLSREEGRLWHAARELDQQLENADYLYEDAALQAYMTGVLRKLYPEYADSISVRLVDSPSLNAFALPNGSIYINTGMLARLDNEAQMATVLAHEGVHFTHKHSWQQQRSMKQSRAFSVGFTIATGIPAVGDVVALSSIYGFSRELEREADELGFQRLRQAGYDVSQAPVTFEYLLAEVKALDIDEPYFFSTHPALEARIKNFGDLVGEYPASGGYRGAEVYHAQIDKLRLKLLADYLQLSRHQSVLLMLERPDAFQHFPPSARFYLGEAYRLRNQPGDIGAHSLRITPCCSRPPSSHPPIAPWGSIT
jgi:predicted Zn-dependent protease